MYKIVRKEITNFEDIVIGARVKLTYRGIAKYVSKKPHELYESMDADLMDCEHEVIAIDNGQFHIKRVDNGPSRSGTGFWRITQDIFYTRGGYSHKIGMIEYYIDEEVYEGGDRLSLIED